jgi:hypothetical protein
MFLAGQVCFFVGHMIITYEVARTNLHVTVLAKKKA